MRKDHYIRPAQKWTGEYKSARCLSDTHLKIYAYCESGPETHRTGIYFVTIGAIADMVGEDRDQVFSILRDLEEIGLLFFDEFNSVILVPCVCEEQMRWKGEPKPDDNRVIEAIRHISALPDSPLVDEFLGRWPIFSPPNRKGLAKGLAKGHGKGRLPLPVPNAHALPDAPAEKSEFGGDE